MHTLKELYKIGNGPSSSHTMGPLEASKEFLKRYPDCDFIDVKLYGSLALTGKGHLSDYIIEKTLMPIRCKVEFDLLHKPQHPNTLEFIGYKNKECIARMKVVSIGGGAIEIEGDEKKISNEIYPHHKLRDIIQYCKDYKLRLYEYVDKMEDKDFQNYIEKIYQSMESCIDRGLNTMGILHGKLQIKRKANFLYYQNSKETDPTEIARRKAVAYAYAVSEENADGGEVVTAPTCGSAGVLAACLRYMEDKNKYTHEEIINALKTAGLIGNLIKYNASISGAEAGCQAEVGTACAMAAAFLVELTNGDFEQISSASEIALEHHLGLTCDPVDGYVQIPCIERNAVATLRAIDAAKLSSYLNNSDSKISFDLVVETMLDTGRDLSYRYRETAKGGLAKKFR